MYADMTAEDLLEWESLYAVDPWSEDRADLRIGILCSLTDACHRTRGQPDPPMKYMPFVDAMKSNRAAQTDEQMRETWESVVAAMEGK